MLLEHPFVALEYSSNRSPCILRTDKIKGISREAEKRTKIEYGDREIVVYGNRAEIIGEIRDATVRFRRIQTEQQKRQNNGDQGAGEVSGGESAERACDTAG